MLYHRSTQRNANPPMFDDDLRAAMAQAMIRNRRANGWVVVVANRSFFDHPNARYVAEGRGFVALGPARRFRLLQAVRAALALVVASLFGSSW
jgi:hypothetical protein